MREYKIVSTLKAAANMILARTFGDYIHSTGGPNQPPIAVYRWRGKIWWIPTSHV